MSYLDVKYELVQTDGVFTLKNLNTTVGFVRFDDNGEIEYIFVNPIFRKKGFAKKLKVFIYKLSKIDITSVSIKNQFFKNQDQLKGFDIVHLINESPIGVTPKYEKDFISFLKKSIIFMHSFVTSCPIPSPGRINIFFILLLLIDLIFSQNNSIFSFI